MRRDNPIRQSAAFFRLATNLIVYMRVEMLAEPAFAASMVQIFEGTCYLTPLLGAWLADSKWGRYKTILIFSAIYVLVRCCFYRSGATCMHEVCSGLHAHGMRWHSFGELHSWGVQSARAQSMSVH